MSSQEFIKAVKLEFAARPTMKLRGFPPPRSIWENGTSRAWTRPEWKEYCANVLGQSWPFPGD
jgi:hypothetical protein